MHATRQELDSFHEFALAKLCNGGADLSMEQLLADWRERNECNAALREAIAEMRAGKGQPLDEALDEIRQELGLPCR
jgi:hypothetical protein